jgi:TonB family protein
VNEAVSDILIERARVADGLSRMLGVSLAAHAVLLAAFVLVPADWRSSRARDDQAVMTISLGGTAAQDSTGLTSISDRPVQSVAPPEEKVQPDVLPAPKPPEMTEPDRVVKPSPPKPVTKPVDKSPSRKPTSGAEIKTGDARVKTGGAAIPFGGLAEHSGGGTDGMRLDVQNFCCPDYLQTMVQRIRQSWNPKQGAAGEVTVSFTIRRDGMLTQVEVEEPSGQAMLDLESRRAVLMTRQLPPLPREFTPPHLTVQLTFTYRR